MEPAVTLDGWGRAATVKSGLFGSHVSIVPLARRSWDGNTLTVPFDKDAIQAAPHHDPDTALSSQDEDDLYRHYGVTDTQQSTASDGAATAPGSPASRAATPPGRPPTRR